MGLEAPDNLDARLGSFGGNERRTFPVQFDEVRDSGAGNGQFTVSGYAAVYDRPSLDLGGFREFIKPGAFDTVLASQPRVTLTIDHDTRYTLATTKNRTLELSTDRNGLKFWARVAPTQYAQDLRILMERGDVDEASFVFNVDTQGQEWRTGADGSVERDITRVTGLHDVCITSAAAYPDATATLVRARALLYANHEGMLQSRKAIPYKKTPLADMGTAWDAGAEVKRADEHDLLAMCAWYDQSAPDPDGDGLPDGKDAYKLPHHLAVGQHPCVWRGVAAAMARLLQAGTQIPDSDRHGVYAHLSKHYDDFQKPAPDFRTYGSDAELRTALQVTDLEWEEIAVALRAGGEDVSRKGTADSRKRLLALRAKSRSVALDHPIRNG